MNNVSRTLYIPLYGKAFVSRKGLFLEDRKAEEIWAAEGFPLRGKSASKWLAYYMGIRAAVFDGWVKEQMHGQDTVVLHIGCGLDSRVLRVGTPANPSVKWYDIDFPEVIAERKRFFAGTDSRFMTAGDIRQPDWLENISAERAVVVMEGVSMYLAPEEMQAFVRALDRRFEKVALLADCYSVFAAKMSRYKNPVNDVGVTEVYGIDDPRLFEAGGIRFAKEHGMTPQCFVDRLQGLEKAVFSRLYAGNFSKKLYRLYEYRKD